MVSASVFASKIRLVSASSHSAIPRSSVSTTPGSSAVRVSRTTRSKSGLITIAHELGHFFLHARDTVHVDDLVKLRDERSAKGTDIQEMEANLFAAELLMPQRFLKEDLKDFGKLDLLDDQKMESLAAKYGVSNQAMAVRLNYLGYLAI